jgi:hypothetical protein
MAEEQSQAALQPVMVDDRWGGFSTDEDMQDTLQRLHEQLGSQQESTAMVLLSDATVVIPPR